MRGPRSVVSRVDGFVLLAILVAIGVYFHPVLASGFDRIYSSYDDGLLVHAIVAHWWEVFTGNAEWDTIGMFYPLEGTLGFSDAGFLFGIIASIFRLYGLDPLVSLQLTLMASGVVGSFALFRIAHNHLKLSAVPAAFVSLFFILGSPLQTASENGHVQLLCAWLVPIPLLSLLKGIRLIETGRRHRGTLYLCLSSAFTAGVFLTSVYTGYFFLFSLGAIAVISFLWVLVVNRRSIPALNAFVKPVSIALGAFIIFLIPFLILYLPVSEEYGHKNWLVVSHGVPQILDLVHVPKNNIIWGDLAPTIKGTRTGATWEWCYGFPPLTLALFLASVTLCGLRLFHGEKRRKQTVFLFSAGVTVLIGWLISVNAGGIFKFAVEHIPGMSVIRAPLRINIVFSIPVALLLGCLMENAQLKLRPRIGYVVAGITAFLILVEQILIPRGALLERKTFLELTTVDYVPAEAEAVIIKDSWYEYFPYRNQILALLLGQSINRPTIFGYSGVWPEGWNAAAADYIRETQNWMWRKRIRGPVFAYDIEAKEWTQVASLEPVQLTGTHDASTILEGAKYNLSTIGQIKTGTQSWPWAWWDRPDLPEGGYWIKFNGGGEGADSPYLIWIEELKTSILAWTDIRSFVNAVPHMAEFAMLKPEGANSVYLDLVVLHSEGVELQIMAGTSEVARTTIVPNVANLVHILLPSQIFVNNTVDIEIFAVDTEGVRERLPIISLPLIQLNAREQPKPNWAEIFENDD